MKDFTLKQAIDASIGKKSGTPVLEINFLGCGGAFDLKEKNSSVLLKTNNNSHLLIDCGYTSYATLKINNLIDKIDYVFVTHTHEDHISGLSCFIYDRWFLHNKNTKIHCTKEVYVLVRKYLFEICNHELEQVEFFTEDFVFFENDSLSVTKINTINYHFLNFPNSGFLFHFQITENKAFDLLYSGDISIPIINLLDKEQYKFLYENLDNTFVFHDMTAMEYPGNPHCNFKLLRETKNSVNKLITYHHTMQHVNQISLQQEDMDLAHTSVLNMDKRFIVEQNFNV